MSTNQSNETDTKQQDSTTTTTAVDKGFVGAPHMKAHYKRSLSQAVLVHGKTLGDVSDANFPKDAQGRVYHLGLKKGELANRIITCGDKGRCTRISKFFDNPDQLYIRTSSRGFTVYTGLMNGKPLSLLAIGMGMAMADFAVREACALVPKDAGIVLVRLGTCGTPRKGDELAIGNVVLAEAALSVRRNYDYFTGDDVDESYVLPDDAAPYLFSKPVAGDPEINQKIIEYMEEHETNVVTGLNITADSFYSSQGRIDETFYDANEDLVSYIHDEYPDAKSLEMETFQLLHLAKSSKGKVRASGMAIVLANRWSNEFLSHERTNAIELECGECLMNVMSKLDIEGEEWLDEDDEYVWNKQKAGHGPGDDSEVIAK